MGNLSQIPVCIILIVKILLYKCLKILIKEKKNIAYKKPTWQTSINKQSTKHSRETSIYLVDGNYQVTETKLLTTQDIFFQIFWGIDLITIWNVDAVMITFGKKKKKISKFFQNKFLNYFQVKILLLIVKYRISTY